LRTDLRRDGRPAAYRLGPARANRAKRTQFSAGRAAGAAERAKQSQLRGAYRAKQSQFPPGKMSHYSSVLLFHHSNPMLIVQNEPNFVGSDVRNKPNFAAPAVGRTHHSTIPAFQDSSPRAAGPGAIVRNEANLPAPTT
jgi:hypothetical protein